MLVIKCPFCGERSETEFVNGGPTRDTRPDPAQVSNDEWQEYLTVPPNPLGPVREYWWHAYGCGQWFNLWRDTLTHEITQGADK